MPKYAAVLKAPDSGHTRHMAVHAATEAEARAEIARVEAEQVAYSLDADVAGVWEQGGGGVIVRQGLNEGDYDKVLKDYRFDDTGRVIFTGGPGTGEARFRGKLAQHHQRSPFEVASLDLVDVDQERRAALIRQAVKLQEVPGEWLKVLDELRERGIPINAVTAYLYGVPLKNMLGGTSVWDWDTSTIKCTLHTGRTADVDTHDYFNDASGTEITGTGYTAGGNTLTCSAPTYDTTSDQVRCDASDTSWTTSTLSATDAEVWQDTGGASSTDPLIAGVDFGATVTTTAGTFQITWDSTGIIVIDVT
jgi:hypothetical protein